MLAAKNWNHHTNNGQKMRWGTGEAWRERWPVVAKKV